ncbi:hypothetical protein [Geomonas terrae]|nr:hypothetical protein [Geomonas terrae]
MGRTGEDFSEVYQAVRGKVKHADIIKGITSILSKNYKANGLDLPPLALTELVAVLKQEAMPVSAKKVDFSLLQKLVFFQCAFYALSGEEDIEVKGKYLDVYANHIKLYKTLARDTGKLFNRIEVPLIINLSLPLKETQKRLAKVTEVVAGIYYKCVEEAILECDLTGIMPVWTFHKDVIGNEVEWSKILSDWGVSYYIYDCLYNKNKSKVNIIDDLKHNSLIFPNPKDSPNSIHKLDSYVDKAERLILTTQQGTFPATLDV